MSPDLCIHHAPCADGFTAAWAVWNRFPDIGFHAGVHGQPPPDVTGLHVLIVDFSYKRAVLEAMGERAASITILDHHKSAQADLEVFAIFNPVNVDNIDTILAATQPGLGNIRAEFDMNRSGAMMAWQFCKPDAPPPLLVQHVQDRDLWRFALRGTREIQADLFSRPYEFAVWDDYARMLETPDGWRAAVTAGAAIERKHHKDCEELVNLCARDMVIGGHTVRVANIPYTMSSDAAHMLAEGRAFGACYFDRADGSRVFSLRSQADGADVSVIASSYGGGGHARAAGFTAPANWEGEAA